LQLMPAKAGLRRNFDNYCFFYSVFCCS